MIWDMIRFKSDLSINKNRFIVISYKAAFKIMLKSNYSSFSVAFCFKSLSVSQVKLF